MGHVGSGTRSLGQIVEKPYVFSSRHSFESRPCLKLGHLGQKSSSLDQTIENHIVYNHLVQKMFSHPSLLPQGQGSRVESLHQSSMLKFFKSLLLPNQMMDLVHIWHDR